ncbi:MAG: glycosyltransferase family 39 protein [Pyrinomonadaceae bacterium]|nr:glycosyltransferase family 39 protein [Pyrinomonadaceae bacterium]
MTQLTPTTPRPTIDPPPRSANRRALARRLQLPLVFLAIFALIFLLHLPLLNLPYYWDEAGYFIPAARDILLTGDFVPRSTLSNAHPPLVMAYLALWWKLFGFSFTVTRAAMLVVAALTLTGIFHLARRTANTSVAVATVVCTSLYPVFFAQSTLAHLDMAAAGLTIWGLNFYLPLASAEDEEGGDVEKVKSSNVRRAWCIVLFALAAMAKETALLAPLALFAWEIFCWLVSRKRGTLPTYFLESHSPLRSFLLLLAALPLALWLTYHYTRTGYFFGNPDYFRYNVEATLNLNRIFSAAFERLWQVLGYMSLYLLTLAAFVAMFFRPRNDAGNERTRIAVATQLVFAVLIAAYASALSVVGGAVLARYMLPVVPLVILICVSTLWRRVRLWKSIVAVVCVGFTLALFKYPSHGFPWEDNLAYRDYILLHKEAAGVLSANYKDARVLTAWPASDELKTSYLGYTDRPLQTVWLENFSLEKLRAAKENLQFDVALVYHSNAAVPDLAPEDAARVLGGRVVYHKRRDRQWIAIVDLQVQSSSGAKALTQQ